MNYPKESGDTACDSSVHNQVQRADRHCRYNRNDDTVPAVLLAAVAEELFLLAVARGVAVAFGTGGRFSAVPFSGVWKTDEK